MTKSSARRWRLGLAIVALFAFGMMALNANGIANGTGLVPLYWIAAALCAIGGTGCTIAAISAHRIVRAPSTTERR